MTTAAVESVNSKSIVSPKKDENKTETVPSSPTVKNIEKCVIVGSPQEEKPKLVLKRVKIKPKKVIK